MSRTYKDRPERLRKNWLKHSCIETDCIFCKPKFVQKNRKTREYLALRFEIKSN